MLKAEQVYPSDLTDQQWECIHDLLPEARKGGRPRSTNIRCVINAIFYLNQSGCAWRYLPKQYPKWQTVYDYYASWQRHGVLKRVHAFLVTKVRTSAKRNASPSTLIIDCQSAKARWGEQRGYDGFKKVQGRKRNILVDTLGLIHSVYVSTARRGDYIAALEMLNPKSVYFPSTACASLNAFYADGGYRPHAFQKLVHKNFNVWPTFKMHQKKQECFYNEESQSWRYRQVFLESNLKPVRWIVERTFAWFSNYRRLSRDYEKKTTHSEAMILVSMMQLMLRRLDRVKPYKRWANR